MKKLLIATTALAMVAGTVQAQSSVTISGRIDQGYSSKTTNAASAGDVKATTIDNSTLYTSFLRFNGSEDLGSGLKANFLIETNLLNTASGLGDRGMWAELQGGFGSIRAGNQNTISRDVWTQFSQSGAVNIVGDLNSSTAEDAGGTAGVSGFEKAIKYTTPTFSGFNASVAVAKAMTDTAGVKSGSDGSSVGVSYTAGKFAAMAGRSSATVQTASAAAVAAKTALYWTGTAVTETAGSNTIIQSAVTAVAAAAAYETKTNTTAIAARYDFGPVIASLTYVEKDVARSNTSTTGAVDRKSTTLSARAPIGKNELFANYGVGTQVSANNGYKGDLKAMQIGIKHNFSKRTQAYIATGSVEHELSATTKNDNKETAVGIVHLF